MATNLLTIGYLKKFTNGILRLNKEVSDIDLNHKITYDELINEIYYPYFKDNKNPKSIKSGLYVDFHDMTSEFIDEESIKLIYPKLMDINLSSDKVKLSPCGDCVELKTTALFDIMERSYSGESVIRKGEEVVNPILRSSNPLFKISKHICSVDSNVTDSFRKSIITATYSFRNVSKKSSFELVQINNKPSDWITGIKETNSIDIYGNNSLINKNGGVCKINVIRNYTEHLYKEDSCGNVIEESIISDKKEDITSLCILSSTNNGCFSRSGDLITVDKQPIGGIERHCIVSAEYDGFTSSFTITQEEGDIISYSYSLSFIDDKKLMVKSLENSLKTHFSIQLKSFKNLLVNGDYSSSIPSYSLNFVKYDNWYDVHVDDSSSDVIIDIDVIEENISKTIDRETTLEIYNSNDIENRIKLIIKQPKNKLFKADYGVDIEGDRYFTYDTIKPSEIVFKPYKILSYENGDINKIYSLDNGNKVTCIWNSSNSDIFDGSEIRQIDFNGTSSMKLKYYDKKDSNDINIDINYYISDLNGNMISECNSLIVTLKGYDVITYEYVFSLDDSNLYKELIWDFNDKTKKCISLINKKIKFINGLESECLYNCEYDYDYNNHYYINTKENSIYIEPKCENDTSIDMLSILKLTQKESGNEISLCLTHNGKPKYNYIKLNLSLEVKKENINKDIWADYDSKLVITRESNGDIVKEIPLNKWWLYPNIENNHDIIYKGECQFIVGEKYNFNVVKLINSDNNDNDINYCILNETYLIENDDEGIELIMNV